MLKAYAKCNQFFLNNSLIPDVSHGLLPLSGPFADVLIIILLLGKKSYIIIINYLQIQPNTECPLLGVSQPSSIGSNEDSFMLQDSFLTILLNIIHFSSRVAKRFKNYLFLYCVCRALTFFCSINEALT